MKNNVLFIYTILLKDKVYAFLPCFMEIFFINTKILIIFRKNTK